MSSFTSFDQILDPSSPPSSYGVAHLYLCHLSSVEVVTVYAYPWNHLSSCRIHYLFLS